MQLLLFFTGKRILKMHFCPLPPGVVYHCLQLFVATGTSHPYYSAALDGRLHFVMFGEGKLLTGRIFIVLSIYKKKCGSYSKSCMYILENISFWPLDGAKVSISYHELHLVAIIWLFTHTNIYTVVLKLFNPH